MRKPFGGRRRSTPGRHPNVSPPVPAGAPFPRDPPVTWGYARVSTADQTTASQANVLVAAGVEPDRVVHEVVGGGTAAATRPALAGLLACLRQGDTLAAVRLDRIGRSAVDVLALAQDLDRKGVRLRLLDLGLDTSTPTGRLLLTVLAAVAEMELGLLRERTRDGLRAARARGQGLGRRPRLTAVQKAHAAELAQEGLSIREISRRLGCGSSVVGRAVQAARMEDAVVLDEQQPLPSTALVPPDRPTAV